MTDTSAHEMTSAPSAPQMSSGEFKAFLGELRDLQRRCGTNRHDQAIVLITVCIERGVDTRARIVGTLRSLQFTPAHVVQILNEGIPLRWKRTSARTYLIA